MWETVKQEHTSNENVSSRVRSGMALEYLIAFLYLLCSCGTRYMCGPAVPNNLEHVPTPKKSSLSKTRMNRAPEIEWGRELKGCGTPAYQVLGPGCIFIHRTRIACKLVL